jgi:hypothetical protein
MEDLIPTKFILLKILLQADLILLAHVTHRYRPVLPLIILMEPAEELMH